MFEVLPGGKGEKKTIVCTACAASFVKRSELETHWAANSDCRNNRFVSHGSPSRGYGEPYCTCGHDLPAHSGTGKCRLCTDCKVFVLGGYRAR